MTETITLSAPLPATAPKVPAPQDVGLRGLPLLDLVISQIELSPETWNQNVWRCETGMCVAGWAATLAGGQWLVPDLKADPHNEHFDIYLRAEADDPVVYVSQVEYKGRQVAVVPADVRARRLLQLAPDEACALFYGGNRIQHIQAIRDELATDEI